MDEINFAKFKSLFDLLHGQDRFKSWKLLQEQILTLQQQIDPSLARDKNTGEFFNLRICQRFIDSIFWTHVDFELSDIRRLYYSGTKIASLKNSNVDAHFKYTCSIHNDTPWFSLISDLASHIYIGDVILLCDAPPLFHPIELKDGSVNREILLAIEQKDLGNPKRLGSLSKDSSLKKQAERIERQKNRMIEQLKLYNYEEVKTPANASFPIGGTHKVVKMDQKNSTFFSELKNLLGEKGDWVRMTIDSCLEIVVVRNTRGMKEFSDWSSTLSSTSVMTDISSYNFTENFSRPLFTFDLGIENIWKLVAGDFAIFMLFSVDNFINRFSDNRVTYKKITGKKFGKIRALPIENRPYIFHDEFVLSTFDVAGHEFFWSDAMFYRMFGSFERPGSLHEMHAILNEENMRQIKI